MKVERIIVTTDIVVTTSVFKQCFENNIDFVIIDSSGRPLGRFWHSKFGSITTIRRRQLEFALNGKGLKFIKEWVTNKINHQIDFSKELAKNRTKLYDTIIAKTKTLEENVIKISDIGGKIEEVRNSIEGYEGNSSRIYFEILSLAIPSRFQFKGRSRQPAKDVFNTFLNYAYGVMYSDVEKACIISGLDPYIGFMHTDNYNKKSLVFDIIENFRINADKMVFHLFSKKLVNEKMYDKIKDGYSLNKDGKRLFFDEYSKYYDKIIRFGNKNMKRKDSIGAFCHKFANSLLN